MKKELFVSVDIEADGPAPGVNSMLSLGAVAFILNPHGEPQVLDRYYANLEPAEGAQPDPETSEWWAKQAPEVLQRMMLNVRTPKVVMTEFDGWLERLEHSFGKPTFVAYPAGFDFTFVYYYLIRFVGKSRFSFSALDIKTLAYTRDRLLHYRDVTKKNMPKKWFEGAGRHTHNALDDAEGQMWLFANIMKEIK